MVWFVKHLKGVVYITLAYYAIAQTFLSVIMSRYVFEVGFLYWLNYGLWTLWYILTIYAHILCVVTDPGAIPIGYSEINIELIPYSDRPLLQPSYQKLAETKDAPKRRAIYALFERKCEKCFCVKPPRTHHCSTCDRCIARLDHHCPWTNNCIAYYTQRPFLQFMFYCSVFSVHSILILGVAILYGIIDWNEEAFFSIFVTFSLIVTGILFVGVLIGLWEQYSNVINSGTVVDRSHESIIRQRNKSKRKILEEVFGTELGLEWLIPRVCQKELVIEYEYYYDRNNRENSPRSI